jgi:hypothetical protein
MKVGLLDLCQVHLEALTQASACQLGDLIRAHPRPDTPQLIWLRTLQLTVALAVLVDVLLMVGYPCPPPSRWRPLHTPISSSDVQSIGKSFPSNS